MTLHPFFVLLELLILVLSTEVPAGTPQEAHGGAEALKQTERFRLTGTLESSRGEFPFTLKVSGGQSRFETPAFVGVSSQNWYRWWDPARAESITTLDLNPALEDSWLMPFRAIRELAPAPGEDDSDAGPASGTQTQEGALRRAAEDYHLELVFDPSSQLLQEARILPPKGRFREVSISYFEYRSLQGVMVPFRVVREVKGSHQQILIIATCEFDISFAAEEFEVVLAGGSNR